MMKQEEFQCKRSNFKGYPSFLDCWSPNINIYRDPRWGEAQDLCEDPTLSNLLTYVEAYRMN